MPPKKADGGSGASKKTQEKVKAKIVEDKTFGLKNKKGGKQQKYIEQVQKQVQTKQAPRRDPLLPENSKDKKEREKEKAEELKALFKPVIEQQKVAKDVDPKSVLCAFFKAGQCTKGSKCKFSHDMDIERKTEKRNVYSDVRDGEDDTMENWDDEKLKDVVNKKLEQEDKSKPKTDIVCKHFLQAIEESKYGWFWECPNGGDKCMYRHALPPGFVLKKDKKKMEEQEETITIEDLVEKERAALGGNLTKVTLESFKAWKLKKRRERIEQLEKDKQRKENEFQAGRLNGLSGRDMFTFRPELAGEDDEEADDTVYRPEEDDEIIQDYVPKDIDESLFVEEEADGSGTIATTLARTGVPTSLPVDPGFDPSSFSTNASGDTLVYVEDIPVEAGLFNEDEEDENEDDEESWKEDRDERSQ